MSQSFFIEPLDRRHNRKSFDCGESTLNDCLKRFARQNNELGTSRAYVAVTPNDTRVCAYFTLSAGAVALTDFPDEVRRNWHRLVPSVHVGRLAVDRDFQGQGLGAALIDFIIERAVLASEIIGILVLELWASYQSAHNFYRKFKFAELQDDPFHLYLSLDTARQEIK